MTAMRQIELRVVADDWTLPEPGTMEIDPVAGIVRIWLHGGEMIISRGVTVEAMARMVQGARDGMLSAAVAREHPDDRPVEIVLRNGNSFQVAPGAVTIPAA